MRGLSIGVRDHSVWGGGGTQFVARISHCCPKSRIILFSQCIFASHAGAGGGGGGVRRAALFGVIEYGTPQRGRVCAFFWKFGY